MKKYCRQQFTTTKKMVKENHFLLIAQSSLLLNRHKSSYHRIKQKKVIKNLKILKEKRIKVKIVLKVLKNNNDLCLIKVLNQSIQVDISQSFKSVHQQIVIKVLVQSKHQMKVNLSNCHQSLWNNSHFTHIVVRMFSFNQGIWIISRHKEVTSVTCFPFMRKDYLFTFVVDIVYIWIWRNSIFGFLRMKDWKRSQVKEMQESTILMFFWKSPLSFSDNSTNLINNIIFLEWSRIVGITVTDQSIKISIILPYLSNANSWRIQSMKVGQCISDFDSLKFSCNFIVQMPKVKNDLVSLVWFPPWNFRVIVRLWYHISILPFTFLTSVLTDHIKRMWWVAVIG